MATDVSTSIRPLYAREPWPPDDTEESIVGTSLHQLTIRNLTFGTNEIAAQHTPPGGPPPWEALSQITLTGFQRQDGTRYKTMPDVFVYLKPIGRRRGSLSVIVDGPPVLIIEVLSDSTYDSDLDLTAGRAYSYARGGVREYLTLDPTGEFVPEQGRGWRLQDGVFVPWLPAPDGRWLSQVIPVAYGIEDEMAVVSTHDGQAQLREGEVSGELRRLHAEIAALRHHLEQQKQD
jgi:hypothetical protein